MARPKRARATTSEGRFLASRIQDAHRRGYTNAEIARAYGMNERTVRRIRSGETSGRRTFARLVQPSREAKIAAGASPSIVRVDIKLPDGRVRTVNARIPTLSDRSGRHIAVTPADVFRVPELDSLIQREIERLERQYGIRPTQPEPETECERSYCRHDAALHHIRDDDTLGHCSVCRCPSFQFGRSRVLSFRPIALRRKPLRIEISGFAQ